MTPADGWYLSLLESRCEDIQGANLESYTVINVLRIIIVVVIPVRYCEGHYIEFCSLSLSCSSLLVNYRYCYCQLLGYNENIFLNIFITVTVIIIIIFNIIKEIISVIEHMKIVIQKVQVQSPDGAPETSLHFISSAIARPSLF